MSLTFDGRFRQLLRAVVALCSPIQAINAADDYRVYVTNERSGDISVIDGRSHEVLQTIAVGKRPRGLQVSPDGSTLYVATSGSPRMGPGADPERAKSLTVDKSADGIAIIDLREGRRVRHLEVGSDPEELALSRDGQRIIVANEDVATASIWDIASGREIATTPVTKEPEGVELHPTQDVVYITCEDEGDIYVLHSKTGQALANFRLGGRPRTVAFASDGRRAYIPLETLGAIAVIDSVRHRPLQNIPVAAPALPMGSAISPDDREVYVTTGRGNHVIVLDTASGTIVATIPVGTRPWGIARSPDGALLFTANGGSDDVSVIDVTERREISRVKVGAGPWGVAVAAGSPP
jgi:YVTN family beta-propeller protein